MTTKMSRNIGLGGEEWDPLRITKKCWACGAPQTVLVKILASGLRSKNRIGVCTRKGCHRYAEVSELETWAPTLML